MIATTLITLDMFLKGQTYHIISSFNYFANIEKDISSVITDVINKSKYILTNISSIFNPSIILNQNIHVLGELSLQWQLLILLVLIILLRKFIVMNVNYCNIVLFKITDFTIK